MSKQILTVPGPSSSHSLDYHRHRVDIFLFPRIKSQLKGTSFPVCLEGQSRGNDDKKAIANREFTQWKKTKGDIKRSALKGEGTSVMLYVWFSNKKKKKKEKICVVRKSRFLYFVAVKIILKYRFKSDRRQWRWWYFSFFFLKSRRNITQMSRHTRQCGITKAVLAYYFIILLRLRRIYIYKSIII